MKFKYKVEADHPIFKRIDSFAYDLHSLINLLKELEDNNYENVRVKTVTQKVR